jgi:hypothetical protein
MTPDDRELEVLARAELEVVGRLLDASNASFLCDLRLPRGEALPDGLSHAVYKPRRGERPLDDFPDGTLAFREVAAYRLSRATGWDVVPPTLLRDGPYGPGMVQRWVDVDPDADVLLMLRRKDRALRRMALFDVVVNNTDRKLGHLLPTHDGHVYGCDHGVCFSPEPKLRTMLWAWRGQRLDSEELATLRRLRDGMDGTLGRELGGLLSSREVMVTCDRIEELLQRPVFPGPLPGRPAIPWPPF